MRTQSFRSYVENYWQVGLYTLASVLFVGVLLLTSLRSLTAGASTAEAATLYSKHSLHAILHDPFFAPYKTGLYLLSSAHHLTLFTARLLSVSFGFLSLLLMFYVLKRWHETRTAIIGTFLLVTSSWFLAYSRQATPLVTYMFVLAAVAYGIWTQTTKRPGHIMAAGAVLAISLVYTPGLIWLVVLGGVWQRKKIARQVALAPKFAGAVAVIFALALLPLIYALYTEPSLTQTLFGLSGTPLKHIPSVPREIIHVGTQLAWHGHTDPAAGMLRVPLLDFFTGIVAVLGVSSYFLHYRLDRAKMLVGSSLLGGILVALQGPVSIVILLPLAYIFASAGIAYLLDSWFTVFPRNPVARGVGISLITIAVLLTGFYHTQRYFVAWPKAPVTKQAFTIKA